MIARKKVDEVEAIVLCQLFCISEAHGIACAYGTLIDEVIKVRSLVEHMSDGSMLGRSRFAVPARPEAGTADLLAYLVLFEDILQPVVHLCPARLAPHEEVLILVVLSIWMIGLSRQASVSYTVDGSDLDRPSTS